jgi:hypothetical protein
VDFDPGTPLSAAINQTIEFWNSFNTTNITGILTTLPQLEYQNGVDLYPNGLDDVIDAVNGGTWGALVISAGAYATIYEALTNPEAPTYNAFGASTIVFDEGRNPDFVDGAVLGNLEGFVIFAGLEYGAAQAEIVAGLLSSPATANLTLASMRRNPTAFGSPFLFTPLNLHPVSVVEPSAAGAFLGRLCWPRQTAHMGCGHQATSPAAS